MKRIEISQSRQKFSLNKETIVRLSQAEGNFENITEPMAEAKRFSFLCTTVFVSRVYNCGPQGPIMA